MVLAVRSRRSMACGVSELARLQALAAAQGVKDTTAIEQAQIRLLGSISVVVVEEVTIAVPIAR